MTTHVYQNPFLIFQSSITPVPFASLVHQKTVFSYLQRNRRFSITSEVGVVGKVVGPSGQRKREELA